MQRQVFFSFSAGPGVGGGGGGEAVCNIAWKFSDLRLPREPFSQNLLYIYIYFGKSCCSS